MVKAPQRAPPLICAAQEATKTVARLACKAVHHAGQVRSSRLLRLRRLSSASASTASLRRFLWPVGVARLPLEAALGENFFVLQFGRHGRHPGGMAEPCVCMILSKLTGVRCVNLHAEDHVASSLNCSTAPTKSRSSRWAFCVSPPHHVAQRLFRADL